jgi:hypothetical protein
MANLQETCPGFIPKPTCSSEKNIHVGVRSFIHGEESKGRTVKADEYLMLVGYDFQFQSIEAS